jgi:cytochrome b561
MGLLDRLQAIDQRLGMVPPPLSRPPSRWQRWVASHPWLLALVQTAAVGALGLLMAAAGSGFGFLIVVLTVLQLPLGLMWSRNERNRVEEWDGRAAVEPPGPPGPDEAS